MIFNSIEYIVFLPFCVILYYTIPYKYRNNFLLVASYYFYMNWMPQYALLLLFSTIITWVSANLIASSHKEWHRKTFLGVGIGLNLGVLFVFKYYNFFMDIISQVFPGREFFRLQLLLPVGISFYTFQALGYTIDVYRGEKKGGISVEKNFLTYALFVSFFPQLVAGPIERSKNLLPQFKEQHKFSIDETVIGLRIILVGMFKKVVIADMIALYVDQVYADIESFGGLAVWLAIFLFTIQIYCDFSGYSDIARGSARILGFRLMHNFNAPYLSSSIKEFWNRWHISLSTWFRDYIYFPLGGGYKGSIRKLCNLMIVFLVSGLWHGAARSFVLWGMLHGIYRIFEEVFSLCRKKKTDIKRVPVHIGITFVIVSLTWNLFRSENIHLAVDIYKKCFQNLSFTRLFKDYMAVISAIFPSGMHMMGVFFCLLVAGGILVLFLLDYLQKYKKMCAEDVIASLSTGSRWIIYYACIFLIMFCFIMTTNDYGQAGAFLYFQF